MTLFARRQRPHKVSSQELGLILGTRLMQTEDLHYGLWEEGLEVALANLPQAQQRYTDLVLSHLPRGARSVLDVGCGTGHVAEQMLARGYTVEGVSPSHVLADMVRERLGEGFQLYVSPFETLRTGQRYDVVLFCESFQYMDFRVSLPKCLEVLNPGGHVLISDFFSTGAPGWSPLRGGHNIRRFHEHLATLPFAVREEVDITEQTAPNLDLVDGLLRAYARPIWDALALYMRSNHPRLARLGGWWLRKRIDTLHRKYFSGARNGASFREHKTYRLLLLQRTDA